MSADSAKQAVLELSERRGVVSRRDLRDAQLPEEYLSRLQHDGELVQLTPGIYMRADREVGEHFELAVIAKRVPHAVVFGITALQVHELTSQVARDVQIAIERGRWTPQIEWPSIRVFHVSSKAFTAGIETVTVEDTVELQVYSVAKTIADLFKFRAQLGLDVAIEALREGWREGRFTMDELYRYADVCRVRSVIQPYTEMLQ